MKCTAAKNKMEDLPPAGVKPQGGRRGANRCYAAKEERAKAFREGKAAYQAVGSRHLETFGISCSQVSPPESQSQMKFTISALS